MNEYVTWLLDAVQSVDPVVRTLLAGFAMMLETSVLVGLFVPGDTIVIMAGLAVASPAEAFVLAIAVLIGSLVGESIGFWLGRVLGPVLRRSALGRRIGEENWRKSERYLRRRGGPAILISRFLPVLHSLVPLTVGMSGFAYRRFLAWTIPACVLWTALYVTVAASAAGAYRELSDQLHFAGYVFVGILVAFAVVVYLAKVVIHRLERPHFDAVEEADAGNAEEAVGD